MALKRCLVVCVIVLGFLDSFGAAALGAALDEDYGTLGALTPLALGVAVSGLGRESLRPSNYPRIEHLRIAGKYSVVGTSTNMLGKE